MRHVGRGNIVLKRVKGESLTDRLSSAAAAKKALAASFQKKISDPELAERRAANLAVAREREERLAQRSAEKEAEEIRRTAEEAAAAAARTEQEAAEKERLLAEQKAARDARYAARKARQRP
ncbi:DUF6481 family protein [Chelatococcus asaccharovorans]|uniref:Uncharacterized protein n=1 Tax=Chelatococcus asaccharovorans TaxID=28210 RepID=A0A2V3TQX6_9HYPH|nr:DUF6481 family protein [Chelatococcus asaccharovorans]MBS7703153.1 hypothetical protein [Chelatococcus asaccharovorans]PXW50062.1 hypothetical protein C7450_1335 [Chelatococcus asaccharovorans]